LTETVIVALLRVVGPLSGPLIAAYAAPPTTPLRHLINRTVDKPASLVAWLINHVVEEEKWRIT